MYSYIKSQSIYGWQTEGRKKLSKYGKIYRSYMRGEKLRNKYSSPTWKQQLQHRQQVQAALLPLLHQTPSPPLNSSVSSFRQTLGWKESISTYLKRNSRMLAWNAKQTTGRLIHPHFICNSQLDALGLWLQQGSFVTGLRFGKIQNMNVLSMLIF